MASLLRALIAGALAAALSICASFALDYLINEFPGLSEAAQPAPERVLYEAPSGLQVLAGPTPSWVAPAEPISVAEARRPPIGGIRYLFADSQHDAAGPEPTSYARLVMYVQSVAGAGEAGVIPIMFHPAYERVVLHRVEITREGQTRSRLDDLSIAITQGGADLDLLQLTGRVGALIRIPDVQSGDQVDVAYSIVGAPRTLGRFDFTVFNLIEPQALEDIRLGSRWPAGQVRWAVFGGFPEPEQTVSGRIERLDFDVEGFTPRMDDGLTPPWRFPAPFFIAATRANWGEVAAWAAPFYEPQPTRETETIAAQIAAEHDTQSARIRAAIAFTQNEVRYFAVLLGEGGYTPLDPAETLRLREGDCKAKSVLLITLLDHLGVEAEAALVHLDIGRGIDLLPPSPAAFNHVIVTFIHEGERYWIDPTASNQGGDLERVQEAEYGYALIADPRTDGLTFMAPRQPPEPHIDVVERFVLEAGSDQAALGAVWTYRGPAADTARRFSDNEGRRAFLASAEALYEGRFGGGPTQTDLADDFNANAVTLTVRRPVRLANFSGKLTEEPIYIFAAHAAFPIVVPGEPGRRSAAFLPYPGHVRHRVDVVRQRGRKTGACPRRAPPKRSTAHSAAPRRWSSAGIPFPLRWRSKSWPPMWALASMRARLVISALMKTLTTW